MSAIYKIIAKKKLDIVKRPISKAHGLPNECYTSKDYTLIERKKIFENKNYQIALNEFVNFKKQFPNSTLHDEASYYVFLSQIYTNKIEEHDDIEEFIFNNKDPKYNELSSSYGEYVFDNGNYDKAIEFLILSKSSNYDVLYKIGFSYYKLENYINAQNYLKKTR